jgi:hypothetical protein
MTTKVALSMALSCHVLGVPVGKEIVHGHELGVGKEIVRGYRATGNFGLGLGLQSHSATTGSAFQ